jgi:Holliday junction resolvasome RuvABC endonuclease subunit
VNKIILGLDCSSTTFGYGILAITPENNINYVKCGYYKPPKTGNILDRLKESRDNINKIIQTYSPDNIGIEDIIQYMPKMSTAKTIITLTAFNRMAGLTAYDYLHKSPELFSVLSIRHGLKIDKVYPKKEEMPELLEKHLNFSFPYIYQKSKKTPNKIKTETYDMADGLAVALYLAYKTTGKIK